MLENLYDRDKQEKATKQNGDNPLPGVHLDYPRHAAFGEGEDIEYKL